MTDTVDLGHADGYADAFGEYWSKGWRSVLWLPRGKKFPPPSGYTGYDAQIPSYPDVMAWAEDHPDANLGLRMPPEVVGLDVDAYGEKTGAGTFVEALRRWGPLPDTVRSTSRDDEVSGIRLYRKPADVGLHTQIRFSEKGLSNIEVVQDYHRYCVGWPSIHPEGRIYRWVDEQGNEVGVPNIADLPDLPARWIEGLRKDSLTEITQRKDPLQALKELRTGQMSQRVENALRVARRELDCEPGSRHDTANVNVLRLLRLGEQGEPGVQQALQLFRADFVAATRDRNTEAEANAEFGRMVFGQRGHDLIASTPSAQGDWDTLGVGDRMNPTPNPTPKPEPAVDHGSSEVDVVDLGSVLGATALPGDTNETAPEQEGLYDDEWRDDDADAWLFGDDLPPARAVLEETGAEGNPILEGLLTVAGLANIEPTEPLIEGMLFRNTLAQLSGHPGSYKSFLTLGMACAIAAPGDLHKWEGMTIRNHGPVIYIAAEGASGLRARILAWCEDQSPAVDPNTLRLYLYPDAVQLGSWGATENLIEAVRALDAVLVVYDTRARCSLDLDENDATEQGKAIENADRVRTANGCTVLTVHHSSKNGGGGRGSSAWDGAVHSDLRVTAEGKQVTIECHKHKDSESGCEHPFDMRPYIVSTDLMPDTEEDARSTLIVTRPDPRGPELDVGLAQKIAKMLSEIAGAHGTSKVAELGAWANDIALHKAIRYAEKMGWVENIGTESTPRWMARNAPHGAENGE